MVFLQHRTVKIKGIAAGIY